jgi:hypothetical protein
VALGRLGAEDRRAELGLPFVVHRWPTPDAYGHDVGGRTRVKTGLDAGLLIETTELDWRSRSILGREDLVQRQRGSQRLCLRQIDLLSRAKHSALTGLEIGRHDPQPEGHIEGIDAKRGPKAELADPMLFRMAGGTERNSVAIARLHSDTTIGAGPHMRRL